MAGLAMTSEELDRFDNGDYPPLLAIRVGDYIEETLQ
jgi:hypothetical protein